MIYKDKNGDVVAAGENKPSLAAATGHSKIRKSKICIAPKDKMVRCSERVK